MKRRILPLFFIAALSLTACGNKKHDISEYVLTLNYESDFQILQLTDLHIGDKDDQDLHYKFMNLIFDDAKAANVDLVVVTGDLFTFASKATARRMFGYFDEKKIPWTVVFGNHDEQVYFSVEWMTGYLNGLNKKRLADPTASYCYFKDIQDDNVFGNCNFAINLMDGANVQEQLIFMDSNRYDYGTTFGGYDYFKDSQKDWYSELVDNTNAKSLMFYHIPLPEINNIDDRDVVKEDDPDYKFTKGEKGEKCCPPDYNSGFFDVIKAKNSTTAMFFGHDHLNDYYADYEGITFAYGIKSTDRVYHNPNMLGGRVITLHDDHSVTLDEIYKKYSEVK